jgi:hypothetical protein
LWTTVVTPKIAVPSPRQRLSTIENAIAIFDAMVVVEPIAVKRNVLGPTLRITGRRMCLPMTILHKSKIRAIQTMAVDMVVEEEAIVVVAVVVVGA